MLCDQTIVGGGSGENRTIHVRLIVEPRFMYKSDPPIISVIGSENENKRKNKYK